MRGLARHLPGARWLAITGWLETVGATRRVAPTKGTPRRQTTAVTK
jgi:hypothetical protein